MNPALEALQSAKQSIRPLMERGTRGLIKKELQSRRGIGNPTLLARGFLNETSTLYGISERSTDFYVNDREFVRTWRIVSTLHRSFLTNKLLFHVALDGFGFGYLLPELLGIATGGRIYAYRSGQALVETDLASIVSRALDDGVVVRPVDGHGGHGVDIVMPNNGRLDAERISGAAEAITRGGGTALFNRYVTSHPDVEALHKPSVNTLRVLTVWPSSCQQPRIARPIRQSVGTSDTTASRTAAAYGLSSEVDPDTGVLLATVWHRGEGRLEKLTHHPDSGVQIDGLQLPHWSEIVQASLALASAFPGLPYALWEFIVGPRGPWLVEANHNPGIATMQQHRPLLWDPGVCAVYQEHGVLERSWRSQQSLDIVDYRAASASNS